MHYTQHKRAVLSLTLVTVQTDCHDCCPHIVQYTSNTSRYTVHPHSPTPRLTLFFPTKGYECKSPEPNKFTCAFSAFADAVSFSGALHLRLLDVAWSDELLQKSGCAERVSDFRNPDGNPCAKPQVIWKGLHARCGVAFGNGCTRKPLNTGRADYFGAVPNLAARICAAAAYGQTLIEPTAGLAGVVWPEFDTSLESIYATPSKSEHQRSASMLHLSSHKNAASRGRLPRQQSASQVNAGSSSGTKHSKNGPGLVDAFSDGNSPRATPDRRRASLDFDAIGPAPDSILGTNLPDSTFGSLPDSILMNLPDSIRDANFDTIESCVSEPPEGLLDGCVSASFTPSAPAGDDASYDATSFSASSETGKNSELLPSNHAPDTFQMTLDLLGGFDLRGVSRRATLAQVRPCAFPKSDGILFYLSAGDCCPYIAIHNTDTFPLPSQALPDVLRNARSMTFDPPSGRGVLPSECDVGKGLSHSPHSASAIAHTRLTFSFCTLRFRINGVPRRAASLRPARRERVGWREVREELVRAEQTREYFKFRERKAIQLVSIAVRKNEG